MILETHGKEFTVLKTIKTAPDAGGSSRTVEAPHGPYRGVLTRVNTSDAESLNSNILSRQKRLRAFGDISVSYDDLILIDGEKWQIVGEPETVTSVMDPKVKSTVIILNKEGKG